MAKRIKRNRIYCVIMDGGIKARFFRDLTLLCETFHLDYRVIGEYLRERGWWCGINYTVLSGTMETREKNFGKY